MNDKEVDAILDDAISKHSIEIDKNNPHIRSLVRLLFHRAYAEAYKDIKKERDDNK